MSDLHELMSRDPLSLTVEDIDAIIEGYRAMRHKFNLGDMRAGQVKKPTAAKKEDAELSNLDLDIKL